MERPLRYHIGRLASADEGEKLRAARAIGRAAAAMSREKAEELLRRFFWSLNDESGAVPFGIPEAVGEVLAARPELQGAFLPILCSLATVEEMSQTGPIERGVFWALGRVGTAAAECSPAAVRAARVAAESHADAETRRVAAWAAERLTSPPGSS